MAADPKPSAPPPPLDTIPARKAVGSKPAARPWVLDTIAARAAVIGDTTCPVEAARRLLTAGYDEPCLKMVVAGELL